MKKVIIALVSLLTLASFADGTVAVSNVTLTAGGTLSADNISEVGTAGISIEGMTMNDGSYTDADGTITVSNLVLNGTATITGGIVGGITTNFTFLSSTDVTGQVWFTSGIITNIDLNIGD